MSKTLSRREILSAGLTAASLAALGLPEWALPVLAQGDTPVPFTDIPDTMKFDTNAPVRLLDIRTIDGPFTPKNQFYAIQHLGQPEVDPATYRLKITGLINKPVEFTIDELRKKPSVQLNAGYECSGNSARSIQGLSSNGMWTGVRLKDLLSGVGVRPEGKEVVLFGADHGEETVPFRGQQFKVDERFGRALPIEKAMTPEPLLAYALNGDPLTKAQGFPVRLVMPGWYGVCNVKWVNQIHLQEGRYVGNYQARWYMSLKAEMVDGQEIWKETEITKLQPKSVISRVVKSGNRHIVHGFVLTDGTPVKTVEVKVDQGSWAPATMASTNTQYSWKLFSYVWEGAKPGEHTLVSRVTDANGTVQPTAEELNARKKTFLEDNSQFPRKVMIS